MKTKDLTRITILTSLVYVGRLIFQFIPNVQPMTTILFMINIVFGLKYGLLISLLSIFISNINLGMGIWTIPQILSYFVIMILTSVFYNRYKSENILILATCCGLLGFIYGFLISFFQIPLIGLNIFVPYYLQGLPFDILHSIGNFIFWFILSPTLLPILEREKIRM